MLLLVIDPAEIFTWLKTNSTLILDLAQSGAIILTLIFTYIQLRNIVRANRAYTSLQITNSHREIWSQLFENPALARVTNKDVDLEETPITPIEEYFVILVANHMSAVYDAYKAGMHRIYEADMGSFFRLPIPNEVWQGIK